MWINNDGVLVLDGLIDDDHVLVGCALIWESPDGPVGDLLNIAKDLLKLEVVGVLDLVLSVQLLPLVLKDFDSVATFERSKIVNEASGNDHIAQE